MYIVPCEDLFAILSGGIVFSNSITWHTTHNELYLGECEDRKCEQLRNNAWFIVVAACACTVHDFFIQHKTQFPE